MLRTAGVTYLSPSQLKTLTLCERKWFYRTGEPASEPLAMGGGFAHALEVDDWGEGVEEYHRRRPLPDDWTDPEADDRRKEIARATIKHAALRYWGSAPSTEELQREVTYLTDIPNHSTLLQVRVDGVGSDYLVEDKLRSGASLRADAIENELRQGIQLMAEVWVHRRVTGENLPVRLRNLKKIDPRKVKTIPLDEIDGVMAEHFAAEGSFDEREARYSDERLDVFGLELAAWAERAERILWEADAHRNTDACFAFGRPCPNLAVCQGVE
jgi:hypothetical protein